MLLAPTDMHLLCVECIVDPPVHAITPRKRRCEFRFGGHSFARLRGLVAREAGHRLVSVARIAEHPAANRVGHLWYFLANHGLTH